MPPRNHVYFLYLLSMSRTLQNSVLWLVAKKTDASGVLLIQANGETFLKGAPGVTDTTCGQTERRMLSCGINPDSLF